MARIVVDLQSGLVTAGGAPTGTVGQISFTRLVEQLRRAGEFRPGETVTHLLIDDQGISYIVDQKGSA